jgi:hypothetical protein
VFGTLSKRAPEMMNERSARETLRACAHLFAARRPNVGAAAALAARGAQRSGGTRRRVALQRTRWQLGWGPGWPLLATCDPRLRAGARVM